MAIRRPNKPPTSGAQVYNAVARIGLKNITAVSGVGFAPDTLIVGERISSYAKLGPSWFDRLRGPQYQLMSSRNAAEGAPGNNALISFDSDGVTIGADPNNNGINYDTNEAYVNWMFRRAPGVFDVVCWQGSGIGLVTLAHNLGVAPELVITKSRSLGTDQWYLDRPNTDGKTGMLNRNEAFVQNWAAGSGRPIATTTTCETQTLGTGSYVSYLFATKPGISKVGSYTGNGSSQVVNCGFSAGARFVMVKRTDAVGDWYVWDTVRGIVAGNDPYLFLNTTNAEVTSDDTVDPDASGFAINQNAATNINVLNGTYLYLAFA